MLDLISREALLEFARNHINKTVDMNDIARFPGVDVSAVSDGYHTFADLYEQRLILSAALAKNNPYAWKSKLHDDGTEPFGGGWFIIGFDTPEGGYTYHYELKDWDLFQCKELPNGKPWDGHTSKNVRRLLSMPHKVDVQCSECEYRSQYADEEGYYLCGGLESEGDNIILVLPSFSCDHGERRNDD